MRIITHDDGRCLTLRLLGELDHAAAQEVMPGIEDAVEEYLPRRCVLDLSGLSFCLRLYDRPCFQGLARMICHAKRSQTFQNCGKDLLTTAGSSRRERTVASGRHRSSRARDMAMRWSLWADRLCPSGSTG